MAEFGQVEWTAGLGPDLRGLAMGICEIAANQTDPQVVEQTDVWFDEHIERQVEPLWEPVEEKVEMDVAQRIRIEAVLCLPTLWAADAAMEQLDDPVNAWVRAQVCPTVRALLESRMIPKDTLSEPVQLQLKHQQEGD